MTRRRLNRILTYAVLAVAAYAAVMAAAIIVTDETARIFAFLTNSAPLAIGVAAALLASAFQKRSNFIEFLRDEWYNIVATKTTLVIFCRRPNKTVDEALEVWGALSMAIDRMRILYRNVGETDSLVGFYPYEPLHDMRRAFEGAVGFSDPASAQSKPLTEETLAAADWAKVESAVWKAFLALREVFLEELDLHEPEQPILAESSPRRKVPGATSRAKRRQQRAQQTVDRAQRPS